MAGVVITPVEFKARFPQFDSSNDILIQSLIDEAVLFLKCYDGTEWYVTLQYYYVAHALSIANQQAIGDSNASLPTTSKTVAQVSVGYGMPSGSPSQMESWFNSTSYGQQFWIFLKQARYQNFVPWTVI